MEIVKYLCEFFFTDFWHWLGGLIFLAVIVYGIFVNIFRIIMAAVVRTKKLPERDTLGKCRPLRQKARYDLATASITSSSRVRGSSSTG